MGCKGWPVSKPLTVFIDLWERHLKYICNAYVYDPSELYIKSWLQKTLYTDKFICDNFKEQFKYGIPAYFKTDWFSKYNRLQEIHSLYWNPGYLFSNDIWYIPI